MADLKNKKGNDLLTVRGSVKKRKPKYVRAQGNQFAKFREEKWRRPKGKGNKNRRGRRGHIGLLKVGYGSPADVRACDRNGLKEVLVSCVKDLDLVLEGCVAVISRTVGGRKKLQILEEAKKRKVSVANFRDVDAKIKSLRKEKKEKPKKEKEEKTVKEANKPVKEKAESKKEGEDEK